MKRALVLISITAFTIVFAQNTGRIWGAPQDFCLLGDMRIDESSGVAPSRLKSGVFYTHNDSGDKPRFFRFTRDGKVDGVYELEGIEAWDWEDMASAVVGGTPYLYLGDIGDNPRIREEIVVHRVKEPTTGGDQKITEFQSYTLRYPDRAHNCETLFVTSTGDIYLVTKTGEDVSGVYTLKAPSRSGDYTLRHVRDIPVNTRGYGGKRVTAGDVSPDGKHVVIRTYRAALEYEVPDNFEDWTKDDPTEVRLPLEILGEAICYSKDGKYLLTTSERAPCPVSILALEGSSTRP